MYNGFIRSFGNSEYGMGHLFRSFALADEMKSRGNSVEFLLFHDEIQHCAGIIGKNGMSVRKISQDFPAGDFLIYDMPYPDRKFIGGFRTANLYAAITVLDYSDSGDENIDNVINLFDHARMLKGRENNHRTFFRSSYEFAIIRKEFFKFRTNGSPTVRPLKNVLVTFGGSDPKNHSQRFADFAFLWKDKKGTVIVGPAFRNLEALRDSVSKSAANITITGPVNNIAEHMLGSDLVVCGGGTTMLETFFLGKPALIIPQTDDEKIFAQAAQSKNACVIANSEDMSEIEGKIGKLESCEFRAALSENGMRLVDGGGAGRIAEITLDCVRRNKIKEKLCRRLVSD